VDKLSKGTPARPHSLAVTLRQMCMRFDTVELQGMNDVQRVKAISHLASLLRQAAGVATAKECDDDKS
jgi:hypothetical protein